MVGSVCADGTKCAAGAAGANGAIYLTKCEECEKNVSILSRNVRGITAAERYFGVMTVNPALS